MGHVKKYVTNARILPTDGQTLLTDKLRELGRRSRQYNPADFAILHDRSSNFLRRNKTLILLLKNLTSYGQEKRTNCGTCKEKIYSSSIIRSKIVTAVKSTVTKIP